MRAIQQQKELQRTTQQQRVCKDLGINKHLARKETILRIPSTLAPATMLLSPLTAVPWVYTTTVPRDAEPSPSRSQTTLPLRPPPGHSRVDGPLGGRMPVRDGATGVDRVPLQPIPPNHSHTIMQCAFQQSEPIPSERHSSQ